jgi:hypothetical protein
VREDTTPALQCSPHPPLPFKARALTPALAPRATRLGNTWINATYPGIDFILGAYVVSA